MLARRDGNFFRKKGEGQKQVFHNPLAGTQFLEFCKKTDLKLRLRFARKFYRKRAMCNYEIRNHQKASGTRESKS